MTYVHTLSCVPFHSQCMAPLVFAPVPTGSHQSYFSQQLAFYAIIFFYLGSWIYRIARKRCWKIQLISKVCVRKGFALPGRPKTFVKHWSKLRIHTSTQSCWNALALGKKCTFRPPRNLEGLICWIGTFFSGRHCHQWMSDFPFFTFQCPWIIG